MLRKGDGGGTEGQDAGKSAELRAMSGVMRGQKCKGEMNSGELRLFAGELICRAKLTSAELRLFG